MEDDIVVIAHKSGMLKRSFETIKTNKSLPSHYFWIKHFLSMILNIDRIDQFDQLDYHSSVKKQF